MKYIKSFTDTSSLNEFIESTTENGYYLLRDESKVGQDRINYCKIANRTEFCITAVEKSTVSFNNGTRNLQYSLDDGDSWTNYNTADTSISIVQGQKMYWRRDSSAIITSPIGRFNILGKVNLKGNIHSLLTPDYVDLTDLTGWGQEYNNEGIYRYIFKDCSIYSAGYLSLPATTLAGRDYMGMFSGCTSLTTAPELPATTLVGGCYNYMFYQCSSLTSAPELPANYVPGEAYGSMFGGCSSLTSIVIKAHQVTTDYGNGMSWMFENCNSLNNIKCLVYNLDPVSISYFTYNVSRTGTFYKYRGSNWSTGTTGIPSGWTVVEVDE